MLSFLSSNKRSRRVAGKLYKNFIDKQNKGYVLAMEKQPIARNNRLNSSTIAPRTHGHVGTKLVFIMKFYLKCVSDNGLKEALKIKSLDSVKVLNLRRLEHDFSYSMWFDFIAMRFVADTADFPAICHVSDAKDITRNRRETSLHYKQYCSHYEFFDGEFLIGAMYCIL